MGRQSKAAAARVENLKIARKHLQPQIEDVTDQENTDFEPSSTQNQHHHDDLLEEGFFILEEDLGSESELDDEDEGSDEESTASESAIAEFMRVLGEAQLAAVKLEAEARSEKPNRKRQYTGNAPHTKRRHAAKRRKLESTGQKFISSFFAKQPESTNTPVPPTITLSDNESAEELTDDEPIEVVNDTRHGDEAKAHLRQLFPEDEVSATLTRHQRTTPNFTS